MLHNVCIVAIDTVDECVFHHVKNYGTEKPLFTTKAMNTITLSSADDKYCCLVR